MELGEEGDYYTYRYTVTTRMTPALVTRQRSQTTTFEDKGEPKRIR